MNRAHCTRLGLRLGLALGLSVGLLLSCGGQTRDPGDLSSTNPAPDTTEVGSNATHIDSESHFLSVCGSGCAAGLTCVCGVCTQLCSETPDCTGLGESIECVEAIPANPSSCAGRIVQKVCDELCTSHDDCGESSVCSGGACRHARPDAVPDSTCSVLETPACEEGEELHIGIDDVGCPTLDCAPTSICRLPFWGQEARCEAPPTPRYWFDAARGRCEVQYTGGCGETENAFRTEEECWNACMGDYAGQCLETWTSVWDAEEFTPSALLPADPIALTQAEATALVQSEYHARLTYPDQTQTDLTLSFSNATAYWVTRRDNPDSQVGTELLPNPGEITCPNAIIVEADAHFVSADGRFDETWPRLQIPLGQRDATAGFEVWLTDTWNPPRENDRVLEGSYQADLGERQCILGSALSLHLVDGALSGSLSHMVLDLPCSEVTPSTPISNPTPDANPVQPITPPPPPGPVWSTNAEDPIAQFCIATHPNRDGLDQAAASEERILRGNENATPLVSDVMNACTEAMVDACTPENWISLEAARCVARAAGLAEGLSPWDLQLWLRDGQANPIWTVTNLTSDDGASGRGGAQLLIDAVTAEVVEQLGWSEQP